MPAPVEPAFWSTRLCELEGAPVSAESPAALALGSASDGPLLTTAGNDTKRFGGGLRFLDPMTFREVSIKPVDRASEFGFRAGKGSMMRASADGRVFTTWTPGAKLESPPHRRPAWRGERSAGQRP